MDNEKILRQKQLLKEILNNALFNDMIQEIKYSIMEDIFRTATKDGREDLYREVQLLEKFVGRLQSVSNELSMIGK